MFDKVYKKILWVIFVDIIDLEDLKVIFLKYMNEVFVKDRYFTIERDT